MPRHTAPSHLDPLEATENIGASYRRYLRTSFRPADAGLAAEYDHALREGIDLTRGPFLQAAAPYAPGASLKELMADGVLDEGFGELDGDVLPHDRPLYVHQETAIRKVRDGRNLIVATGTGSGKTECFLLPILDSLLRERAAGTLDEPGVRALLLYPMNALANDQIKRIRQLLASFPDMTFGRYIGDTDHDDRRALDSYRRRNHEDPLPNELISRTAMQERPPHLLLTNYAMLEYLLLRPADSPLFDGSTGGRWRFLVLDEIHVYDGARGAELGMLLRRVRDRVNETRRGELTCIGTSATLGSDEDALPRLVDFAQQIFDERFELDPADERRRDVVLPTRLPLAGTSSWELAPERFLDLVARQREGADPGELAALLPDGIDVEDGESAPVFLHRVLSRERHVVRLQRQLELGAIDVRRAARVVFGEPRHLGALLAAVELCVAAHPPEGDAPLLPARYHYLLRALEGAFVCLNPRHPAGRPRLLLSRHEQCPSCTEAALMVESAVCRRCGALYAVGQLDDEQVLRAAKLIDTRVEYFLLPSGMLAPATAPDDEDEEAVEWEAPPTKSAPSVYCCACGKVTEGDSSSCDCHGPTVPVLLAITDKELRDLRTCLACGGRANASIAYRFVTGADAPVAVIATSLYQELPESKDPQQRYAVGSGRKLLSFADSRQDAAFFAPYLDRTYARAIERRLIWEVLSRSPEPMRFGDLMVPVRKAAFDALVLDEDDSPASNSSRVRSWLFREAVAVDRRQSLDGVGLAEVTVAVPRAVREQVPGVLTDLGFSAVEALDLVRVLLDSVRQSAALWVPDGVDISDPMFSPRNVTTVMREQGSERGVLAWVPGSGLNRRLDFIRRLFEARNIDQDPAELLPQLWHRWLAVPRGDWSKVLLAGERPGKGTVYALDPEAIEFVPVAQDHQPFRCNRCHQVWWRSVSGVCPTYRCPGSLALADQERMADDHYRTLYTDLLPTGIRVEEHTGQLETRWAAEVQQDFIEGRVNALSCSTTFELGVDVGEVQAVLMRNVPPSPANYVQRAGRAGRRAGSPALVVTYAQRRNHDLQFFANPHSMIDGEVSPPIVSVDNANIVRRHVHAVAFAAWQRHVVEAGGEVDKTTGWFFFPPADKPDGPAPVERFMSWLESRPPHLMETLARTVPNATAQELGIADGGWIRDLVEIDVQRGTGWLTRADQELRKEVDELSAAYEEAKAADKLKFAQGLASVRDTLLRRRLLDYLAQRVVLPKYGFPVDVVTLDVNRPGDREAARLDLSRDLKLAISDYAPGTRVVAAKLLWESDGLRRVPGRELLRRRWAVCACGRFRSKLAELVGADDACPSCGGVLTTGQGTFVSPVFGFVGHRSSEKPGEARPPKLGGIESFFDEYEGEPPPPEAVDVGGAEPILVRFSRQARITVINQGAAHRGFYYCSWCGHATDEPPRAKRPKKGQLPPPPAPHQRPGPVGGDCTGSLSHIHLGHQYLSDAVELVIPGISVHGVPGELSVLHALLAAAPSVGIARSDVEGTAAPVAHGQALLIYDVVPGGAGHARHLQAHLRPLLMRALAIVSDCECGEDSSCYACLRSYSNQRDHDRLHRGMAKEILAAVLQEDSGTEPIGVPGGLDDLSGEAQEEVAFIMDDLARSVTVEALRAGVSLPVAGWQADDPGGSTVEVAWPAQKVAILAGDVPSGLSGWLAAEGWDARPSAVWQVDELVRAIGATTR